MLRLIDPNESHPLTLEIDDSANPTIIWVRPMTERDAAKARLAGRTSEGEDLTSPSVLNKLCENITKIENVRWKGVCPYATDDPQTINEIMFAWPQRIMRAWAVKIFGFATLDEKYSKNSDGSSAFLDTGSPLVEVLAGTSDASAKGQSDSGSQASKTVPSSSSEQ